ncbi:hypothetical protein HPB50_009512 [Hyalomma asiaticum]|uniref:Uncharacterized protein n=1 Tax=Hyalomma asiaticum TaxID=266040 RepID=A0ACB7RJ09_HYAAI|nr:hypothetical protein HPB50_009512 [Hyalomma asiaticum]
MEVLEGRFADHFIPCTASARETCQIVPKLVTWNKLLLGSTFEIKEKLDTSNQLCITNSTFVSPAVENADGQQAPPYSALLGRLLTTHRCIGSVSLKVSLAQTTSLAVLRTACQHRWIKAVSITGVPRSAASSVFAVLPRLTNIEHLSFATMQLYPDAFIPPLCALLQASSSLKSLHISGRFTGNEMVEVLFAELLRKPTLHELHFEDLSYSDYDSTYPRALKEYLSSTTELKVLSVSVSNRSTQRAVLEGVLENTSIQKFSLNLFIGNEESTTLVSRIINENRAIRTLSILSPDQEQPGLYSVYNCWVNPLIANDTLEEVELALSILHPTMWFEFLRALPHKENLKIVRVASISRYSRLREFCAVLKHTGSDEKVCLSYPHFLQDAQLLRCKAIRCARIPRGFEGRTLVVLIQLQSCQHLRSLSISIRSHHMALLMALAEFMRSATALQILELSVESAAQHQVDDPNPWWNFILEALAMSTCLRQLLVRMSGMRPRDAEDLAELLKRNEYVSRFQLSTKQKECATAFFRCLSEGIEENYTLRTMAYSNRLDADTLIHWLAVKETTWRNCGLLARAARIKEAAPSDRYVTRALDRVVLYPALLDDVAWCANLDRGELSALVRDRLRSTQSLDGFMRVAGVVKDQVICHPAADGRLQVNDLNEDCWRHVRQYLMADDIEDGA